MNLKCWKMTLSFLAFYSAVIIVGDVESYSKTTIPVVSGRTLKGLLQIQVDVVSFRFCLFLFVEKKEKKEIQHPLLQDMEMNTYNKILMEDVMKYNRS